MNKHQYRFKNTIRIVCPPQKDAIANMKAFIAAAKLCAAFGEINWDSDFWNITNSQIKDRGHKQREYNLWFTQHQKGIKSTKSVGEAFIEPFASFAKAFIRLRHELNNQTSGNHMVVIQAMRYLYNELAHNDYDPIYLITEHFIKAEKLIQNKLSARTARQLGVYLGYVARVLNDNHLTHIPLYFQTSIPVVEVNDRLSPTAKKRRYDLLPRQNSKLFVRPISESNISTFICGGSKHIKSVFDRYGYCDKYGNPFRIRSHGFRHLLNTLSNEGGLTDIELANWFGRKNIHDNASYDHRTAEQLTEKARQMMLLDEIVGPITNAALALPFNEASEFIAIHVNAVHYTPYGLCLHDFAQNPCDKHLNCLSNCKEYHRTIGDIEERNNLKQLKIHTIAALEYAKNEAANEAWGANNWVRHNQSIIENIDKALSIDNNMFSE